ncbi:MAG: hypothetical protein MMC33_000980 [Icmadophila ericetorum]|nr:hypothetical protein [Icmadophila ericetorum]
MPFKAGRISEPSFKVATGVLLGVATVLAIARTVIRFCRFRTLHVDDYFLFFATVALVIGTILLYSSIQGVYAVLNIELGNEAPPMDFVQQLILIEKINAAASVFLWLAIFGVKFSFLFFFRQLVRNVRPYIVWWWCVFAVLIPSWVVCMCAQFIGCAIFGPGLLTECVATKALHRENAALQATVILDIITDFLLISIPAILLWRVHISLRRKLLLGGILCLSIFMIIISIIKITLADLPDGQVDSVWGIFWLQAEACVAVIMVSISAFRSLFSTSNSRQPYRPSPTPEAHRGLWQRKRNQIELTTQAMSPTLIGAESSRSLDTTRTVEDSGTQARDIQTSDGQSLKNNQLSHETFV